MRGLPNFRGTLYLRRTRVPFTNQYIGLATNTSPFVSVFKWSNGFATRYADPATPASNSANASTTVDFSPNGDALSIGGGGSPNVWKFSDDGLGTKYAIPSPNVGGSRIKFDKTGSSIHIGHTGFPYMHAYAWSYSEGFGTKYANPTNPPANTGSQQQVFTLSFTNGGDVLVFGALSSPNLAAHGWSSSTGYGTYYGSVVAGTSTLVTGLVSSISANNAILVGHTVSSASSNTNSRMSAWQWSGGWGTRYAAPSPAPGIAANQCRNVVFNKASNVAIGAFPYASTSGDRIYAYTWSHANGFGTRFSNPANPPTIWAFQFVLNDQALIAAQQGASSFVTAWEWSNTNGFGTKYSDPQTNITIGYGVGHISITT